MKKNSIKTMCLVMSTAMMLTACGSKKAASYEEGGEGYTTISSIDGITFEIPQNFSNKATAVTRIANDQEFTTDGIYSYANGEDEYMFFCMDELVILANKGTSYNFSGTETKESALSSSSVIDSMCSKLGKKFSYTESTEDGVYKIIGDVAENISITTELYGDYVGRLAVIEDGTEEWSVLAGVKGSSLSDISKEQLAVIDTVVSSMKATHGESVIQTNTPDYDVVINDLETTEAAANERTIPEADTISEPVVETEESATTEVSKSDTETDEVILDLGEAEEAEETTEVTEIVEAVTEEPWSEPEETEETPETTEPVIEEPSAEEVKVVAVSTESDEKVRTNQRERDLTEEKVYSSDIYSLLKTGNYGIMVNSDSDGEIKYPVVHLKAVYTGNDAVEIVKKQASSTTRYDYFEAPLGYSWQVAEYDIIYTGADPGHEIDVRMLGVDGNVLKYRGVPAPQRTYYVDYDIEDDSSNETLRNIKVFYAVPNGCKEYVLKFGDGEVGTETEHYSAYFHVGGI